MTSRSRGKERRKSPSGNCVSPAASPSGYVSGGYVVSGSSPDSPGGGASPLGRDAFRQGIAHLDFSPVASDDLHSTAFSTSLAPAALKPAPDRRGEKLVTARSKGHRTTSLVPSSEGHRWLAEASTYPSSARQAAGSSELHRRRGLSVDASREDLPRSTSVGSQPEVQPCKRFLRKEIEARSAKLSSAPPKPVEAEQRHGRLFIVSTTLPFTVFLNEETNELETVPDDSAVNIRDLLASGQRRRHSHALPAEVVLVGEPVLRRKSDNGFVHITPELRVRLEEALGEQGVVVVFMQARRDSFANKVIFPLFHYTPPSMETGLGSNVDWEGYEFVTEQFRDAVLKEYTRGDLIWINDFALMLLPKLLRKERPDIPIGYYMNCVFPSSEVYRILPQREEILRGVLSSNVIGFHTFQYVRHFLTSCTRILGVECGATGIEACEEAGGTFTKVITVPLGINVKTYLNVLSSKEIAERIGHLIKVFADKKILVSVDALEEKKGIPHKIMAFHKFLQKEPAWAANCVFIQIVEAPDREREAQAADADDEDLMPDERTRLLHTVYEMVGEVNSTFGTIGHLPLHFLCQEFSRVDLAALFCKADILLDTPLRDMISRSAHAFLCCQEEKKCGVLILSEFSGSAQSLRAAALVVNPWDTNGFADAIQEALEMEPADRVELHRYGSKYVTEYTLQHWAANFLDELLQAESECEAERIQIPPQLDHEGPLASMRKATRKIIILGFSGALLPRRSRKHSKILPKLSQSLLSSLQVIAEDPDTHVVILSGASREQLPQALHCVPCWLIAEGGESYREPSSDTWISGEHRDLDWMGPVRDIMEYFAARTPGSTIVQTSSTVQWMYQKTQGDHAAIQSKDLLIQLWAGPLSHAPAEVVVGIDCVSVRPTGISKALSLEKVLQHICCEDSSDKPADSGDTFVICVADLSMRDEDVFTTVKNFFGVPADDKQYKFHRSDENFSSHSWDNKSRTRAGTGATWDARGTEREPTRDEASNLAINSKSLGDFMSRYKAPRNNEEVDDPPFGLARNTDELPGLLPPRKVTSEPKLYCYEEEAQTAMSKGGSMPDDPGAEKGHSTAVYTCTVSRKATKAGYHLSDTHDVAFLLAQFARELRHKKEALLVEKAAEVLA